MKNELILLSLGFWVLMLVSRLNLWMGLFSLYGCYLYFRFHKVRPLFLWTLFAGFSLTVLLSSPAPPEEGLYKAYEIHTNYVLAVSKNSRAAVVGNTLPGLYDEFELSSFSELSPLNNFNLFSFKTQMARQNITHCARLDEKSLVKRSHSIQAKLFQKLSARPLSARLFYGIGSEKDIFSGMSLGIIGFMDWLRLKTERRFGQKAGMAAAILFGSLYGFFITFPSALFLKLFYLVLETFFERKETALSCWIIGSLIIMPQCGFQAGFVIPLLLRLISLYCLFQTKKRVQKIALIWAQVFLFGRISFLNLFGYGLLKKIYTFLFASVFFCSIFSLPLPDLTFPVLNMEWTWSAPLYILASVLFLVLPLCSSPSRKNRCIAGFSLVLIFAGPYLNPFFHIYMLDVGQGDCTLIVEPFLKSAVMIDAAGKYQGDYAKNLMVPFLQSLHINQLDALIITHDDLDHSGSAQALMDAIPVKQLITDSDQEIEVDYPFLFLLPERQAQDENDRSLICLLAYDELTALFMGDASAKVEKQLVRQLSPIKVSILKVGHHGSATSTSRQLLQWCHPDLALVSAGKNNRYHHPHSDVMARLKQAGCTSLVTKDAGAVHILSFRNLTFFQTASGFWGRLSLNPEKDAVN